LKEVAEQQKVVLRHTGNALCIEMRLLAVTE
jgi:hypothetical protein